MVNPLHLSFRQKNKKIILDPDQKRKRKKKIWIISIISVLILATIGVGYAYWKGIFTKNYTGSSPFFSFLKGDDVELKGEGDGRINILLLGYGGSGHNGAYLTDTIQVLSIDPNNKTVAMLSIPRDLYVETKKPTYAGKINAIYSSGKPVTAKSSYDGATLIKDEVGTILDLPIHYYVAIDFSGFEKAINSVGGIDVTVDKDLYDAQYPAADEIHYQTFSIKAGERHLDGATALKYARSRESSSDFDRSKRQQKVMTAFKSKLQSSGALSDPTKVISLLNTLGTSVKTDFSVSEIKELAKLIKDVDTSNITTAVLDNSSTGLLASFTGDGGISYLKPKAGIGNFTAFQKLAHEIFVDPLIKQEAAKIEIINTTSDSKAGDEMSTTLKSYNYNITNVTTSSTKIKETVIYDYSNGDKKYTLEYLAKRLSANVEKKSKPSGAAYDIQILIGENDKELYAKTSSK